MRISNDILAIMLIVIFVCAGWWAVNLTERQTEIMQRQAILSRSIEDISYQIAALSSEVCNLDAIERREKHRKGAK